ncbi:MAG: SDR family oxidoreductase [Azospirillaceae bacterium]|nr:SDR family oxidoreductase [Azospirillaceae bacterium]
MSDTPAGTRTSVLHNLFDLSGQVALITGGSRGLGLQIAEALGEFGAHPVLVARKTDELDAAVAHLAAQGIAASAIPADLGRQDAMAPLVERVMAAHGRIDVLVNNAGTTWGAPAQDHTPEQWAKVVDLNLNGVFFLTQAVARAAMLPLKRGRIVNVASVAGLQGHHPSMMGTVAYGTTKGAVVNLTRVLAAEWGPHGIAVNALAPGFFPSKMTRGTLARHEEALVTGTPLGKLGNDNDLKGAALLLASAAGGHITGQILAVDGGAGII